jgi:hypothetical protein
MKCRGSLGNKTDFVIHRYAQLDNCVRPYQQKHNIIIHIPQLKYYKFNTFPSSSGHLHGVLINLMFKTCNSLK